MVSKSDKKLSDDELVILQAHYFAKQLTVFLKKIRRVSDKRLKTVENYNYDSEVNFNRALRNFHENSEEIKDFLDDLRTKMVAFTGGRYD